MKSTSENYPQKKQTFTLKFPYICLMLSMDLEKHIVRLIQRNDQLVLPQLGTLVSSYQSAIYDETNDLFNPPSKSVLFRSEILKNDDTLFRYLSNIGFGTIEKIEQLVHPILSDWKEKLNNGERIAIQEIGYLYQKSNKEIAFKQDSFLNLLNESYGLKPVGFITKDTFVRVEEVLFEPIEKETAPTTTKIAKEEEPTFVLERPEEIVRENRPSLPRAEASEEEAKPKKKFNKKYLIALAIVPLFYAYWIPVRTSFMDTGKIQMAELNPFQPKADPTYLPEKFKAEPAETEELSFEEQIRQLPPEVETFSMAIDDELYIPVRLDNHSTQENTFEESNQTTSKETVEQAKEKVISSDKSYHLIGGCFSNKSNAEAFAKSLGSDAFILDYNKGLHRVSIGQFDNRNDAKNALKEYRSGGESAWVLKK